MGPSGRLTIGPRPSDEERKPYRILDGNQEAPTGFGFYIGKRTTTYEVVRRGPQGVRRFLLDHVTDIGLEGRLCRRQG
ncbi:integrase [Xanthomonas arboricola pv. juglandis]|nr:integrase [Xanthomonas arboricola pv. juglandis]